MLLDLLEGAGNLFDLPGSMVRDAVTLNNPFDQLLSPLGSQNRMSGRDVLEHYGALSPNQAGLDFGDVAGGALGMAMDPLSYISGVGALKFLARGSKLDDVAKLIPKAGKASPGTALVPYRNPLAEVLGMGDAQPLPTSGGVDPSAFLANAFGSSTPLALPAPAAPFYSRLRRAVEALPDKPIKSQSLLNTLKKNPEGISMDEWEWTMMPKAIEGKPVVSKRDLLAHLDKNAISLEKMDQATGDWIYEGPTYSRDQIDEVRKITEKLGPGPTKSPLNGTELNYPINNVSNASAFRNLLAAMDRGLPFERAAAGDGSYALMDILGGKMVNKTELPEAMFNRWTMPGGKDYRESLLHETVRAPHPGAFDNYVGPHWPQPNVGSHLRTTTRDIADLGPVHFLDEVQSDWHQTGKKSGYGQYDFTNKTVDDIVRDIMDKEGLSRYEVYSEFGGKPSLEEITQAAGETYNLSGVPDSPFKNAWQDAALKRALYDAAAKGSPGIGWTTGRDSAAVVGGELGGQMKFYDEEIANRLKKLLASKGQKNARAEMSDGVIPTRAEIAGDPVQLTGMAHYMHMDPQVRARILAEGFPLLAVPLMAALGYGLTPGGNERL